MESELSKNRRPRSIWVMLSLLLVVTILVGALPQTQAAAVVCKFKHKVVAGETIIYLGNLYQVAWQKIAEANNMQPPYALQIGQTVCIPEGQQPDSVADTGANDNKTEAVLTVVGGLRDIIVSVENFAPKTSYYIRVFPQSTGVSFRIGHFTTNKEGDFTDFFQLPPFIPRTRQMTLCVKNVWTDATSCVKFDDIGVYAPVIGSGGCKNKEGR